MCKGMERECEATTGAAKQPGRKKKSRECEAYPEHLWCPTCRAGHRRKACLGPNLLSEEATPTDFGDSATSDALPSAELPTGTDAPAAELPTDVQQRPTHTSAGKPAVRLEYAQDHIRDQRYDSTQIIRKPKSTKVKVSALEAAIADREAKLSIIEAKLKALMKDFRDEQKRADALAKKEIDRDSHKRQNTLKNFFKPVVDRATTSSATAHVDTSRAVGYSKEEPRRTFCRDVKKIQTEIIEIAGDDPLRQLQLADGV